MNFDFPSAIERKNIRIGNEERAEAQCRKNNKKGERIIVQFDWCEQV